MKILRLFKSLICHTKYEIDNLVKSMLPQGFEVKDLTDLTADLPFETKAAYFKKVLYFGSNANKNDALEEIFHASLQSMISSNKREQLLLEGKKLIDDYKGYVKQQIESSPEIYSKFNTQKEKEDRAIEEFIAKKFVNFYNQSEDTNNRFIDRIFKWLRDLFNNIFYNKIELESFFNLIKDGYYKDKSILSEGSNVPATALLKHYTIVDDEVELLNLNANDSLTIIKQLSNLVYEAKRLNTFTNFKDDTKKRTGITKDEINTILDRGIVALYEYYTETNDKKADALNFDINNFSEDAQEWIDDDHLIELKAKLKEEVYKYIQEYLEKDVDFDELEDEEEVMLSADTIGADERGFDSISQYLKEYIATVGIPTGKFIKYKNNRTIEIKELADPNTIYYALARGLKNTDDDYERFVKFKKLAYLPQNRFVKALYEKFVLDITENQNLNKTETKKVLDTFNAKVDRLDNTVDLKEELGITDTGLILFTDLIKGFDFWVKPSMIITAELTEENNTTKITKVKAFNPNQNSAEKSLLNISKEYYFRNESFFYNESLKEELYKKLQRINRLISPNTAYVDEDFTNLIYDLHEVLSKTFLEDFTPAQSLLLVREILKDEFKNFKNPSTITTLEYEDVLDYSEVSIYYVRNIISGLLKDINKDVDAATLFDFDKARLSNDLNSLFKSHASITEKVQESTYKNADGKNIYLYQWRNASLVFLNKHFKNTKSFESLLNNISNKLQFPLLKTQEKDDNYEYMKDHYFIDRYMKDGKLSNSFKLGEFYAIEGIKDSAYNNETTFAGMSNNDFLLYRLLLSNTKEKEGLQPVFLNLMEAKKTALFVEVPKIDFSDLQEYYKLFAKEIQREKSRIERETLKIENLLKKQEQPEGTYTLKLSNQIAKSIDTEFLYYEKYHPTEVTYTVNANGRISIEKINGRAFTFSTALKGILSEKELQEFTNSELDVQRIGKNFNNYFQDLIKHLKENDLISLVDSSTIFFNKEGQLHEGRKKSLLSEFLNTIYLNQLISGDPATIVKNDVVDFNKRMASLNATIQTVYNNFTNPSLGIDKPVTELKIVTGTEPNLKSSFSNDKIDVADAQTYTTVKGMRRYLYGLNKLTKPLAEILDTIDAGGRLSKQQVDYMFENNIFLNVVKPVGYDGKHYIKTGMFMLTKDFTSHNGRAIPGMEFLHNLRENMEQHEIDMFMPQSASKMMVTNIFETENFSTSNFEDFGSYSYTMSAKDFGQQLENPSGKQLIIDPSQQLEILMNEQEGTIKVYQAGKIKTILDIQKLYSSLLANRDELMFNQAFNEISDESFQLKYKDFLDKVKASLVDTGADPQTIDFFTPTETGKKYNLNMAITKDKFAQLFFAHFTKGILKQKVSGDALALVSSANVKVLKKVVRKVDSKDNEIFTWEVIKKNSEEYNSVRDFSVIESNVKYDENDNFNQLINNGIDSELITKLKELGEGAYFYDELRSFKPKWVETPEGLSVQGYFAEAMLPTWKKDLQISEQTKWMWSTRIPSQDKHSGLNIEWVDELPIYYGNTIITAKEIVLLSGSGYSIDKLFLVKPELYYNKQKGEYVQYDDKNSEEQYITYQYNYNKILKKKVKNKLEINEQYQRILTFKNELYSLLNEYNLKLQFANNEEVVELRNLIEQDKYILETKIKDELREDLSNIELKLKGIYDDLKSEILDLKSILKLELLSINIKTNSIIKGTISETLDELNIPFNNKNVAVINNEFLQLRQLLNTNEHNVNSLKTKLTYPKLENKILESTDDTEIERLNLIKNLLDEYYHVNSDKIAISKTAVSQDYLMGKGDDTLEDSTYYEIDKEGIPLLNEDNQLIIKNVFEKGEFKKEFPYSYHSFLGQIFNHKNTQTGKSNIGIAVNYNLLGIALNRLGVSLNEPIFIDDLELKDFGLLTYDNRRIFDIASMLVSAATDEAKDQQNAKYGLTVEALNIAIPLLLLKTPPKIIILILQQPVIKQYLKLVSKKEQIFLSKTDLENKFVGNDTLLRTLVNHNLSPRTLTIKDLIEGKSKNELNNNIQANIVDLVSTIININKEIKPLNSYIKLKKGLGSTLQEFDKLYEDSTNLQTIPTLYTNLYEKLNTDRVNEDSLQKQYFNYEHQVIPKINTLLNKHFLDYQDFVKQLKGKIDFHTRFFKSEKDKAEFNKKFLSFFYTYIWKDSFADKMEIFQNPLNSKKFIDEYKELKFQFPQNLFLQRVRVFNNELVFQTYVKLPKPLQLSINDSFRELHFIILTNPKFKKYQDFIKSLYLYHARKDGWLFRNNSLAKALPAEQFLKHSESLDNYLDLDNTPNDMLLEQLTYHFMQNFKNEGLSINKLLKPDLRNTTSDNFGFTDGKYFIDINKVEDEDKFLIELIKSKQDYVYAIKRFMIGDKVVANKTLKPAYALNINKGLYELSKVYYRLNRFASEEYILTQIDKLPLVTSQEQSIITRVEYKKVDSKLNTNENELTNDYNLNTNLQYEDVRELGEVVYVS